MCELILNWDCCWGAQQEQTCQEPPQCEGSQGGRRMRGGQGQASVLPRTITGYPAMGGEGHTQLLLLSPGHKNKHSFNSTVHIPELQKAFLEPLGFVINGENSGTALVSVRKAMSERLRPLVLVTPRRTFLLDHSGSFIGTGL